MTEKDFAELATEASIQKAVENLKKNGIEAFVVESAKGAKSKVLGMVPKWAEVMVMSSETLKAVGLTEALSDIQTYLPVKAKLSQMKDPRKKAMLGAAPTWTVGSVHAVTEEGGVLIASNTGSQLPAYVYGAERVILVVGTQKIVKDTAEGVKRIYDYVLPLESERMRNAGFQAGSFVSKLLIINREIRPGRLTLIFVKEKLGF